MKYAKETRVSCGRETKFQVLVDKTSNQCANVESYRHKHCWNSGFSWKWQSECGDEAVIVDDVCIVGAGPCRVVEWGVGVVKGN